MNWIIRKSNKLLYHTQLHEVLLPILEEVKDYNWLLSDLEYGGSPNELPINMDDEYFILAPNDFEVNIECGCSNILGEYFRYSK